MSAFEGQRFIQAWQPIHLSKNLAHDIAPAGICGYEPLGLTFSENADTADVSAKNYRELLRECAKFAEEFGLRIIPYDSLRFVHLEI